MDPLTTQQAAFQASQAIAFHDRVFAPDGAVGTVIGFYGRETRTVLVLLDSGISHEYVPADLHQFH
jgi:hypothetical protein